MGKSTVSKMFRALKIPVFDSDKKVKEILDKNHQVKEQISKIWPDSIIENKKQKIINKVILSDKIFRSKIERKKLENIIHPIVRKERKSFLNKSQGSFIVGLDVPLLYETGMDNNCDYVFLVNTTKNNQKKRVLIRSNMTEKKFEFINNSQWSFKKKAAKNPYIISTSFGKTITFLIVLFYLFKIIVRGKLYG